MKHLPNLLTLGNLLSGCIAIAFILNAQPFLSLVNDEEYWVTGVEQLAYGCGFIFLAGLFDVLDGWAARALKIHSPIGADLDSLADVVSFGVAPSMIMFKMLWGAYMREPHALDVSMWLMLPAFALVCCAALRLARFNVYNQTFKHFTGMPTPAAGLFIATLPIVNYYNPFGMGSIMQNKWVLYLIIAVVSWLMVSNIRFIKLLPHPFNLKNAWPQLLLVVAGVIGFIILKWTALPLVFILYIILSLFYKPQVETVN